jgi:hypothetical protein
VAAASGAGPSEGGFDVMQVEVGLAKGEDHNEAEDLERWVCHNNYDDDGGSNGDNDDIVTS